MTGGDLSDLANAIGRAAIEACYRCVQGATSRWTGQMTIHVGRRKFIAALGGVTAWPLVARAQQPGKLATIGVLHTTYPSYFEQFAAAVRQGFGESGWTEGQNVAIEYRWAEGRNDRRSCDPKRPSAPLIVSSPAGRGAR
jgi:hypothetical protein